MKNERKRLILFSFNFYSLFGAWKIVGIYKQIYKQMKTADEMFANFLRFRASLRLRFGSPLKYEGSP